MKKSPPVQVAMPLLSGRRWLLVIYAAMIVALLWRLIAAYQIAHGEFAATIFAPHKATDLRTYMELSRQVAAGEFSGPFYYQPFYYSVFLVLCRWISGGSVWMVVIVQALLGALTAGIAGVTAARVAGRVAGAVAAWLTALCTILIFYTPFHQIATLQAFNVALMSYYAVRAFQSSKWRYMVLFGVTAAVASLTRGNVLLVFVPLVIALAVKKLNTLGIKKTLGAVGVIAGVFLLVESPFIIYNSLQLGRLSGPSTAADAVLALGNTPEAPPGGREPGLPAGPMEYPQSYEVWMADRDNVPVVKRIFNYFIDEPASYLELTFRKLLLFWDYREIPNNVSLVGEGATATVLMLTVPVAVLLVLGLAGMFCMVKKLRRGSYLALYITVIFYWGATAAFYNLSRFRAPVLPVMAIFAGIFAALLYKKSQQKDWKFIRTYGALAVIGAVFLSCVAFEFYRNYIEVSAIRMVRPSGTHLDLPDGRTVWFYHGPQTFGNWQGVEAPGGTALSVKFPPAKKSSSQAAELEFCVQSQHNGVLRVSVEDKVLPIEFTAAQFKKLKIRLPESFQGDVVNMQVLENSADAFFIVDLQRNYEASRINDVLAPGELVMRLTR